MNFSLICRLCTEPRPRLRSIFESHPQGSINLLFEEILRVHVDVRDGLPQQVCRQCATQMRKIQETISFFRGNDLKLRQQLIDSGRHVPLVEIKEEEVEVEVLEEACKQELVVADIGKILEIKHEVDVEQTDEDYINEEYLEQDENEIGTGDEDYTPSKEEIDKLEESSESNDDDERDENSDDDDDSEDDSEDSDEDELLVRRKKRKAARKKRQQRNVRRKKNTTDSKKLKGKPGRKKTRFLDPDRPRQNDHKCYVCKGLPLENADAVLAHLCEHRDLLPYTCPDCVKEVVVINNVTTLNNHLQMHRKPYKCQHCDRHYSSSNAISLHVQMVHPEVSGKKEPHFCEVCGGEFPTKLVLLIHLRTHTKQFSCEHCGKQFVESHKLRRHIGRVHEQSEPKHECKICHKKLKTLDAVTNHIKTFHSDQEFHCKYCQRRYTSINSLRWHEKRHEKNENYQSPGRWTQFYVDAPPDEVPTPGALKKYKCLICNCITTAIGGHLRKKHFPEEYRCSKCGEVFNDRQRLKVHVLEHEQGPAFRCPICGREFSLKKNLICHLKTKKHADHPLAQSLEWLGVGVRSSGASGGGSSDKSKVEPGESSMALETSMDIKSGVVVDDSSIIDDTSIAEEANVSVSYLQQHEHLAVD
ncbi:zinc finger protein 333-like [Uranotaenia lowii]|uniref:zinc finger protein 333-like n=1 Tax=Uranotaenia lowii TaxID=190385 RepID=UPI00247893A3|nr:zinc finger protein 333-like [Uranotaenia lowii]